MLNIYLIRTLLTFFDLNIRFRVSLLSAHKIDLPKNHHYKNHGDRAIISFNKMYVKAKKQHVQNESTDF